MLWSFTAVFFTLGTIRIGPVAVNQARLIAGTILLSTTHLFVTGRLTPGAEGWRWLWLGISGVVGLSIGDAFLLVAMKDLGPRLALLIMSTSPIVTSIIGWVFFREKLGVVEIAGIAVTLASVAWVVAEKRDNSGLDKVSVPAGILFAAAAAVCQSLGLVAAKQGMSGGFSPLSSTLMRMVCALAAMLLYNALRGDIVKTLGRLGDGRAATFIACGSVTGPFLGVWLSLTSVAYAKVGVAATLMSLVPIFLIPLSHFVFSDKVTARSIVGTVFAFAGSALLFLG